MLPKKHIILGLIFSLLVYFIFHVTLFQVSLIFFASVFIDLDHYIFYVFRKKSFDLKKAYDWHKNLPKNHKPMTQIFHTVEFLVLVFMLSYFWYGFLFILIGMLFHSITDILEFLFGCESNRREFFLIKYLITDKHKYF
jgi:hypothetical protein